MHNMDIQVHNAPPTYKLEVFEGPLDLLLSLIEKHKIDIYDIQISLLLEQYLDYIDRAQQQDWNLTADFIEMAARLTYIKSYALLPQEETEEEEDPKQTLEQMLQQYAKYKNLSQQLRQTYIGGRIFFRDQIPDNLPKPDPKYQYPAQRLEKIYRTLMIRYSARNLSSSNFTKLIGTKFISVGSKVGYLLTRLQRNRTERFERLFDECTSRSDIVATFLAVLELLRSGRLDMETKQDDILISITREEPDDE